MMKNVIILIAAFTAFTFNNLNAQSKFGYVNATELMYLMPEMKTVEHVLDSFQTALEKEFEKEMDAYKTIEAKLQKQINEGASQSLIDLTRGELQTKAEFLQRAEQVYAEDLTQKQTLLLTPLNDKILKALKEVAQEKGLNYIFDISKGAVLYWNEADDVSKDVRKKLGISETATLPKTGGGK